MAGGLALRDGCVGNARRLAEEEGERWRGEAGRGEVSFSWSADCANSQRMFSASSFVFEEPSFDQFLSSL